MKLPLSGLGDGFGETFPEWLNVRHPCLLSVTNEFRINQKKLFQCELGSFEALIPMMSVVNHLILKTHLHC